jgi:hypothetical protein
MILSDMDGEPPGYVLEEQRETPASLREKQVRMEQQVYRIWTCVHLPRHITCD